MMVLNPSRVLFRGLYAIFGICWIPTALFAFDATNLLEILFFVVSAILLYQGFRGEIFLINAWLIFLYVLICGVYAMTISGTNIMDFMLANKCFWYLFFLMGYARKAIFKKEDIQRLNSFILIFFFIIYFLKRMVFKIDRPMVLIENNFEMIFVSLLFYASYLASGKINLREMIIYAALVWLSGSRSAAVVAVVVLLFSFKINRSGLRNLLVFGGVLVGGTIAALIFVNRDSGGIEDIDRYKFFEQFIAATRGWGIGEFMLGAPRMTALPPAVCSSLSYYQHLFSYRGDGSCYSVIFHSFDLRAVFDHGIIGLAYMLYCVWIVLSWRSMKEKLCILTIIFMTGLSVSSLNNVYLAISVAILSSMKGAGHVPKEAMEISSVEERMKLI